LLHESIGSTRNSEWWLWYPALAIVEESNDFKNIQRSNGNALDCLYWLVER
jgi:hypothetical protein